MQFEKVGDNEWHCERGDVRVRLRKVKYWIAELQIADRTISKIRAKNREAAIYRLRNTVRGDITNIFR